MLPCLSHLKYEFQKKKFGFGDVNQERFANSQWNFPSAVYITYRVAVAIYTDFWLIYTASKSRYSKIRFIGWPYALTNWTYFMESLYFTMHASATIFHYCKNQNSQTKSCTSKPFYKHLKIFDEIDLPKNEDSEENEIVTKADDTNLVTNDNKFPIYFTAVWILYNIASLGSFLVTIVYYAVLWPNREDKGPAQLDDIQVHGINSVLILIEHCISAVPIRILHVIYPMIYGLVYVIFSIFLWISDDNHISYPEVLDWNDPGQSIIILVLIAVVVFPLLQLIFFGIYKLKIYLLQRSVRPVFY